MGSWRGDNMMAVTPMHRISSILLRGWTRLSGVRTNPWCLLFCQILVEANDLAIFDLPVLLHQHRVGFPMVLCVASFAGPDIDHVLIPVVDVGALPHDNIEAHGVETVDV